MEDDVEIEYSSQCRHIERDGRSAEVDIYRIKDHEEQRWRLELVDDATGTSIVWDALFDTDLDAVALLREEIEAHGLDGVLDDAPVHEG